MASPDWSVTLLRYFNPAGAHPSGEIGEDPQGIPNNLFPFVAQVAVGVREELNIFGDDFDTKDGTGCRDYVHVEDLACGHVSAVQQLVSQDACPGVRVYNLGTGRGYTVLEVVAAFEAVIGRKLRTRVTNRRPGDVDTCFAATDKAREELGFTATKTLVEMCKLITLQCHPNLEPPRSHNISTNQILFYRSGRVQLEDKAYRVTKQKESMMSN